MGHIYQIRVEGHLDPHWSEWFDNLTIIPEADGETLITGPVPDQPALHGLLKKIRDLGLPLLLVKKLPDDAAGGADEEELFPPPQSPIRG